eukprot:2816039-Pleurochrysis_carterae.AAC.2
MDGEAIHSETSPPQAVHGVQNFQQSHTAVEMEIIVAPQRQRASVQDSANGQYPNMPMHNA